MASCSTRSSCTGQCTPPSWTRSGTERTLLLDPIICDMWAKVCSRGRQASLATANTQDILVMTHLLFHVCVAGFFPFITRRSVAAAVATSLMRFSTASQPGLSRRRGECSRSVSVHHSFWLCLTPSLCVFSAESRHCSCIPQSLAISSVFRFFLLPAQHVHAVSARISDHGSPNTQF